MKSLIPTLLVAAIAFVAVDSAQAQKIGSTPIQSINYEDAIYDFEVYAAQDPGTGYYIVWEMYNGGTIKNGPLYNYQDAERKLTRILMGGWEPAGYVDVNIVELPIPPNFMLFDTVGTRAEANQLADFLESFGLLTQIKRTGSWSLIP